MSCWKDDLSHKGLRAEAEAVKNEFLRNTLSPKKKKKKKAKKLKEAAGRGKGRLGWEWTFSLMDTH